MAYEGNVVELKEDILNNNGSINKELLRILLEDPYFDMLKSIIKSDNYKIFFTSNGTTYEFNISSLIRSYEILLFDEETTPKQFDRIMSLRELTNFDKFISKYKDKMFNIVMDDFTYKIKASKIIEYLSMPDEDCKLFINQQRDDFVSLECFLYAVDMFLKTYNIQEKYVLPKYAVKRIKNTSNSRIVDIEAINQINDTNDCLLSDVVVDEGFKREILKDLDKSDMTQLEKAIYVYILLCKKLTYDPVYFAYDQKGERTEFHKNPSYIGKINSKNNRVVCYEFNALYGYFLNALGIHYENSYSNKGEYGKHSSLTFRCGKFIVSADSVTSILSGDIVNSKVDANLNGLVCLNNNPNTVKEFNQCKEKIYSMFKPKQKESVLKLFRDSVNFYNYPLDKKVETIIKKANDKKLSVIDTLGYILKLRREMLSPDEVCDFSYIVVRYNGDARMPIRAIITVTIDGKYKYYIYKPCSVMAPCQQDILNDMFVLNDFEYLVNSVERVPGIHDINVEEKDRDDILGEYGTLLRALARQKRM